MRLLAFSIAASVMVATASPAAAAWHEYKYEELGVIKQFPAEPKAEKGVYKTIIVPEAPAHIFSVTHEDVKYSLTVVDLMDRVEKGSTIQGECVFNAEKDGKPIASMTSRIEIGPDGIYGRIQTNDLNDGSRSMTACFFTKGRLYRIQAIVLPTNSDFPNSSQAIRFINGIGFDLSGVYH